MYNVKLGLMSRCFNYYPKHSAHSASRASRHLRTPRFAAIAGKLVGIKTIGMTWCWSKLRIPGAPPQIHDAQGKLGSPRNPIFSTINWGWLKHVKTRWIMGCWALFSIGAGFRWPIHSMSYEWTIGIFISLGEFHQEPWDLGLHHSWTNSKSRGCLNMRYMGTCTPNIQRLIILLPVKIAIIYTLWLWLTSPWYRWPIEIDDFPS